MRQHSPQELRALHKVHGPGHRRAPNTSNARSQEQRNRHAQNERRSGVVRRQAEAVDQLLERIRRQLAQVCDGLDASALEPLQRERKALVVHGSIEAQRAEERRQPGGVRRRSDLFEPPYRYGWRCSRAGVCALASRACAPGSDMQHATEKRTTRTMQ
jgi:hypothetical protein